MSNATAAQSCPLFSTDAKVLSPPCMSSAGGGALAHTRHNAQVDDVVRALGLNRVPTVVVPSGASIAEAWKVPLLLLSLLA
jgi:hypothetical protein